jgi:hypothetical protein
VTITPYRRHSAKCPHKSKRGYKGCRCPRVARTLAQWQACPQIGKDPFVGAGSKARPHGRAQVRASRVGQEAQAHAVSGRTPGNHTSAVLPEVSCRSLLTKPSDWSTANARPISVLDWWRLKFSAMSVRARPRSAPLSNLRISPAVGSPRVSPAPGSSFAVPLRNCRHRGTAITPMFLIFCL